MLPHPRNHCPIKTVHNLNITKTLRGYYDEVNKAIDEYNKENGQKTVPIHRFACKPAKENELKHLRPGFEDDLYTPNEWLSKKVSTMCFNAITNSRPKRKIQSIVHVPNTSKIGRITKKTIRPRSITQQKQHGKQHQDASISSTTE